MNSTIQNPKLNTLKFKFTLKQTTDNMNLFSRAANKPINPPLDYKNRLHLKNKNNRDQI